MNVFYPELTEHDSSLNLLANQLRRLQVCNTTHPHGRLSSIRQKCSTHPFPLVPLHSPLPSRASLLCPYPLCLSTLPFPLVPFHLPPLHLSITTATVNKGIASPPGWNTGQEPGDSGYPLKFFLGFPANSLVLIYSPGQREAKVRCPVQEQSTVVPGCRYGW